MCVGNACGGMSVTTIYPTASSDPGLLIMVIAGIVVSTALLVIYLRFNYNPGRKVLHC